VGRLPYTIAIIGAGASGTLVAAQLMRQVRQPLHLFLIERRSLIGRGVAYGTTNACHLLNTPAERMSAYQDRPDHFVDWLKQHPDLLTERATTIAYSFVPRCVYGAYLQATLEEAANLSKLVTLERIHDEVYALSPRDDSIEICLQSGRHLHAHQVILAIGNFPSSDPPVSTPEFYHSPRYRSDPWSADVLANLANDAPVLLLGSGLTMVDIAVALHGQGHVGPIIAVSRRGLLPQPHSSVPLPSIDLSSHPYPMTAHALMRWVQDEINQATSQGMHWGCVIDAIIPSIQSLWQALPVEEKKRFLRHMRPYWDAFRHRIAPAAAKTLDQLRTAGQFQLYAGRVRSYEEGIDDVAVTLILRHARKELVVRTGLVINCTGLNSDIRSVDHPLIASLLAQGLIRPGLLGLGVDTTFEGALVNAEGHSSSQLWTLSSLRRGQLWETTAISEIRQQAEQLAQDVLQTNA
jgi:uncharacterized NAD(P)/FAD-binding protein YdhS